MLNRIMSFIYYSNFVRCFLKRDKRSQIELNGILSEIETMELFSDNHFLDLGSIIWYFEWNYGRHLGFGRNDKYVTMESQGFVFTHKKDTRDYCHTTQQTTYRVAYAYEKHFKVANLPFLLSMYSLVGGNSIGIYTNDKFLGGVEVSSRNRNSPNVFRVNSYFYFEKFHANFDEIVCAENEITSAFVQQIKCILSLYFKRIYKPIIENDKSYIYPEKFIERDLVDKINQIGLKHNEK